MVHIYLLSHKKNVKRRFFRVHGIYAPGSPVLAKYNNKKNPTSIFTGENRERILWQGCSNFVPFAHFANQVYLRRISKINSAKRLQLHRFDVTQSQNISLIHLSCLWNDAWLKWEKLIMKIYSIELRGFDGFIMSGEREKKPPINYATVILY